MARILVVDNDSGNADVLQLMLGFQNHQVKSIYTSKSIKTALSDFGPDLILMDILLDQADGREVCNEIKDNSQTSHIPIMLVTAMLAEHAYAVESRADAVIFKPYDYLLLLELVYKLTAKLK